MGRQLSDIADDLAHLGLRTEAVVGHDHRHAESVQARREMGEDALVEPFPVAAVQEQRHGAARIFLGHEEIVGMPRMVPVNDVQVRTPG